MNLRIAALLGLACMATSAAAGAHMIAVDQRQNSLAAGPLDTLAVKDSGPLAMLHAAQIGGSSFDLHANAGRYRPSDKGTWETQFHGDNHDVEAGLSSPSRDSVLASTGVAVAVPEPATLGLMGVGLLLLTGVVRRARRGFRAPMLTGLRQ